SSSICTRFPGIATSFFSAEKYKRFTTRNRAEIQYNPLIPRAKLEKLENKENKGKNKQNTMTRTRDFARSARSGRAAPGIGPTKSPPTSRGGRHAHKSETRISAIAYFSRERKQKKKALPLSPPRFPAYHIAY